MNIDTTRIAEQVNAFWSAYGYAVIIGTGLLGLVLVVAALVKAVRSPQRDRWVSGLAAVVVLAWTSEGLWEVGRYTLGLPVGFAVMTFFVFEAMMLSSALQAEQHRRRRGTPGPAGRYVWVLAACTAIVVAVNAATVVEALLRFVLPLAAAGLWWVGITAARDEDADDVRQAREQEAARRAATWAVTPRTVLVGLGVMRPGALDVTDAERERRVRRMVVAADRLHTATAGGWRARRAAARLRRLARLADAPDVAEVRARVERTTGIVALVTPTTRPGNGAGVPDEVPGRAALARPGDRPGERPSVERVPAGQHPGGPQNLTRAPARVTRNAVPGQATKRRPAPARAAGDRDAAERAWRDAARAGAPMSGGQLAARFGVDESTARRWIRRWRTTSAQAPNGHHPAEPPLVGPPAPPTAPATDAGAIDQQHRAYATEDQTPQLGPAAQRPYEHSD